MSEPHDPFANAVVWEPPGASSAVAVDPAPVAEPEPAAPDSEEETPDASEPGGEAPPEAEDDPEEPPAQSDGQTRLNRRFSDLTSQIKALNADNERLRAQNDAILQRVLDAQRPPPAPEHAPPPPADGLMRDPQGRPQRPRLEQYATQQDYEGALDVYEDAVADWHVQRHVTALEQRRSGETALGQVRHAHPDYEQVVQQWTQTARLSNDVAAAIAASPQRYELCYYLATHPDAERALAGQYGPGAFFAVGELHSQLRSAAPPPANGTPAPPEPLPPISSAPPPIRPTRGEGRRAPRSYEEMSDAEFFEVRNKEANERRWR